MADRRSYADYERYSEYENDGRYAQNYDAAFVPEADSPFYPGEPIGAPPRRRGSSMGRAFLVIVAMAGCGWGLLKTEAMWRPWLTARVGDVMAEIERTRSRTVVSPAPGDWATQGTQQPAQLDPLSTTNLALAPEPASGSPVATEEKHATTRLSDDATAQSVRPGSDFDDASTRAAPTEEAEAAPLPQPKVDPADPYQKRALAVGLHPELSRVLLSRMSDADYRNAGIAISKAVAEAADTDKFVWPRQRPPKLALFEVHFVAGAAPDCRRYIVTVTMNGWSTTAQPMEKCGIKRPNRKSS